MRFTKILSLFLALLMLLSMFVACGNTPAETTGKPGGSVENDDPRQEVADTVPTDLRYDGETVNFLVRGSSNTMYQYELACEELLNDPLYDAIHYRNIDVETRLGLKIKAIVQPGAYEDRTTWNNSLSASSSANTPLPTISSIPPTTVMSLTILTISLTGLSMMKRSTIDLSCP